LNLLYTKFFYGFEKEGRSNYFFEKAVFGHYFNYKIPIKETYLGSTIMKALNQPLFDIDSMGLRPEAQVDADERERIEMENNQKEQEKLAEMTPREKKRYIAEQKRKEQIEADLAPEKMLLDEM